MNTIVFIVLVVLPVIKALCYSPMIHGLAPDVILPHMIGSEVLCPPPHVFDYFNCICADPSVVTVRMPPGSELGLSLVTMDDNGQQTRVAALGPALLSGLPDMHDPRNLLRATGGRIVPELNPFGSYNLPANSNILKAAVRAKAKLIAETAAASKQLELLEKARWQHQLERELEREAAVVANLAVVAAATRAVPVPSSTVVSNTATLDGFMRDTLRRILYGY